MIVDTHCHLNDERLAPEADAIAEGLFDRGIESAICVGYDMPSSEAAVRLAEKHENIYAAIGIHPHDAVTADYDSYERLATLSSSSKVVAIGEIGLDYHYDLSPRAIQKGAFREQIELADVLGLPIALHIREAYEDARQILFEYRINTQRCNMKKFMKLLAALLFGLGGVCENIRRARRVFRFRRRDYLQQREA